MYKHILIATDGTELAQKGVDHGLSLARHLGARVTIVVVSELFSGISLAGEAEFGLLTSTAEFEKASDAAAKRILNAAGDQARKADVPCELRHVANVAPADGILDVADKEECSLIVMASHGRRGLGRLLLGSQAAQVVNRAKVPVLIVR
jgi:nucleotide-binding universal stress UspA family protein